MYMSVVLHRGCDIDVGLIQVQGQNSGVKVVRVLKSDVSHWPATAVTSAHSPTSDGVNDSSNIKNEITGKGVKKKRRLKDVKHVKLQLSTGNVIGDRVDLSDSRKPPMLCTICGKMVRSLKVHMQLHQRSHFECADCGRKFARSDYLTEHRRVHSDERPFLCGKCGRGFGRAANLRAHLLSHSDERRYPCNQCGKSFRRSSGRNEHIRNVHEGLKGYQCMCCPRAFSSANGLKMHMMGHTNERPYGCTMCPKRFKSTALLDLHSSVHTGERRFLCSVCGRGFTQKSAARLHEMTQHTADGGRCHECELCGQRFSKRSIRDAHVRRHKGEKPHACSMCHWTFAFRGDLRNHMIKKHKVKRYATAGRPQQSSAAALVDNTSRTS